MQLPLLAKADTETTDTLSVTVSFKQNRTELLPNYMDNEAQLRTLAEAMKNPQWKGCRIFIIGYASPEGPYRNNESLSRRRALRISRYLQDKYSIPDSLITLDPIGVDWPGLVEAVAHNPKVPMGEQVLKIVNTYHDYDAHGRWVGERTSRLKKLNGGRVWNYLLRHIYPYLRGANAMAVYKVMVPSETPDTVVAEPDTVTTEPKVVIAEPEVVIAEPEIVSDTVAVLNRPCNANPVYWSLHTNLLFDALAIPNIGAEVYLGKNFSLAANYWNSWWKSDVSHRYWRTYGAYLAGRYWFGKAAHAKPLTGHQVGVYAQALLYDFEWGGTGYLSGEPGKNIFHHPTLSAGFEYGYALPISRRLNFYFSLAVGYLEGQYHKYEPVGGIYVWRSKHNRRWVGPTKLEVSLVWLLGRDNYNRKKGGAL